MFKYRLAIGGGRALQIRLQQLRALVGLLVFAEQQGISGPHGRVIRNIFASASFPVCSALGQILACR